MFDLIKKLNLDICFRCSQKISKIEELSIEHKIAWLNSNNPKELHGFCQDLLKDEKLRLTIGTNARKMVAERFSMDKFVNNWQDIFSKVTN